MRLIALQEFAKCLLAKQQDSGQQVFLRGLHIPDQRFVGTFRGEPSLENIAVRVVGQYGVEPHTVADELKRFESKLQALIGQLDGLVPVNQEPDADQLSAILDVCAWSHAEWIRIHPFANGNRRTARLWANGVALRHGLPPFIRLRPQSNDGYGDAGAQAMLGDWRPTAIVFRRLKIPFDQLGGAASKKYV